ncbi:hypothetical protein EB796_014930 [Bugula neritina]|uniref:Uncharacterized protein n=1 Tax=Bugula neritina TaxID=10212 RepID=A0A7J7JK80_BUGNE|nr:hypothetical protein EB796_014930 [Bugula neritina]
MSIPKLEMCFLKTDGYLRLKTELEDVFGDAVLMPQVRILLLFAIWCYFKKATHDGMTSTLLAEVSLPDSQAVFCSNTHHIPNVGG